MKILYGFAAFVAVVLFGWLGLKIHDRNLLNDASAKATIAKLDTAIARFDSARKVRDTVYLHDRTEFRTIVANPASTKAEVVKACNQLILSCDVLRATNDSLVDSLKAQRKTLKSMKERQPPRLSFNASALYDFVNGGALGRAGVDLRLLGPLSVTGEIEAAPQSDYSFKSRAVAGLRFTFK
jgi:hypothetical protein